MKNKISRIIIFQKDILSIDPNIFCDKIYCLSGFVFCIISAPAALVSVITMFIFRIYHAKDSLFLTISKKFKIVNLYISGYVIFFIMMLSLFVLSISIGLPLRFLTTGNLDGVFNEMFAIKMKDIVEMIFCICFYQFSVFYMIWTEKCKGITNFNKRREFLFLVILSSLLFFFTREWILEYDTLLYVMFIPLFVGVIILPIISYKWKT
ncbi:MAG: hypothetical protein RR500_00735 [Bacilli bacterium]